MPQRWTCRCGAQVLMQHSFCGACGIRWDKVSKQGPNKPQPRQGKPTDTNPQSPIAKEFAVPSVGYALPSSGTPLDGQVASHSNMGLQNNKSIKTLLHQRANKIGKIEARISKLESALKEIEVSWPRYVHQLQSMLTREHTRCTDFHTKATTELGQLRSELQGLLQQELTQVPSVSNPQQVPVLNADNQQLNMLKQAWYQQVAMSYQPMGASATMEVDPAPSSFVLPNLGEELNATPSSMTNLMGASGLLGLGKTAVVDQGPFIPVPPPTLPSQSQPIHHVPSEADMPPGNWNWPPAPPVAQPDLHSHSLAPGDHFPNPLYKAPVLPVSSTPDMNEQKGLHNTEVPAQTSHPVNTAVQQAVQAMLQMNADQGQSGLTPQQLQQIDLFAQQQARYREIEGEKTPRPVRSALEPMGIPGLTKDELLQVLTANMLLLVSFRLLFAAAVNGVPGILEHPRTPKKPDRPSIWRLPWLQRMVSNKLLSVLTIYQGNYGSISPKPTNLGYCNLPRFAATMKSLQTPIDWEHIRYLEGKDQKGSWMTSYAKEYPERMNSALAQTLIEAVAERLQGQTALGEVPDTIQAAFNELYCGDDDQNQQTMRPDYAKHLEFLTGMD
eukprot:Skav210479  [mRNA]  locus=scaffold737:631424:639331:+ [translate_table: standard]